MNREVLESQWPQIRNLLAEKFSNLTEEDIRQINGRYDQLVAKLQQKYGYSREEAEDRIRSWNFERGPNFSRGPAARDDRIYTENRTRKEEDTSSPLKWLLAIGLPLLLLGLYLLSNYATPDDTRTTTTTTTSEQMATETPADRSISTGLRNAFLSQSAQASELQNVQISTHNGIVTLSGSVPNRTVRDSLVNSAENYPGVREVVNHLQIR